MALGELKNGIGPDAYAIYQQVLAAVVERDHPVGSLYISNDPTSPASLFGGTWEQIKDRFILAAGDTYAAGSTGGEAAVALTEDNNGPHTHILKKFWTGTGGVFADGTTIQRGYEGEGSYDSALLSNSKRYELSTSGNGTPHNNIPPYVAMYVWKRIA